MFILVFNLIFILAAFDDIGHSQILEFYAFLFLQLPVPSRFSLTSPASLLSLLYEPLVFHCCFTAGSSQGSALGSLLFPLCTLSKGNFFTRTASTTSYAEGFSTIYAHAD